MSPEGLKHALVERAKRLGFDVVRVAHVDAIPEARQRLHDWLAAGFHGTMEWMADTDGRRGSPAVLWPEAKSVIILGMNYGPVSDPLALLTEKSRGAISVYADRRDYHEIIKGKLKEVTGVVKKSMGDVKVFVDTAPILEKTLAEAAGVGWQGKHSVLVSREFGSWLFLGVIFTTVELPPDEPETDHCGSCRACLDICPTNAFPQAGVVDARRCISYLTIELEGHIPLEFREKIGNRIFGCDDCLAVCPWNKFARQASEVRLTQRDDLNGPPLSELLALTDTGFRSRFANTPVRRIGRDRFVRNVLVAAGNSDDVELLPRVRELLEDASPVVRAMAVWALRRLAEPEEFMAAERLYHPAETNAAVRGEWTDDGSC